MKEIMESTSLPSDDLRTLIIVTYPRTGSTALNRIINSSPGYTIRGESVGAINHLYRFSAAIDEVTNNIPLLFPHLDSSDDRSPIWGAHEINSSSLLLSIRKLIVNELLHPEKSTCVIGWKETMISPVYDHPDFAHEVLLFLRSLFPGVRVIFNIRDSVAVSQSSFWKYRQNSYWEAEQWRQWIIERHEDKIFGDNGSLLLDHDIWSNNPYILTSQLRQFGINVDVDVVDRLLKEQLTHISDM